MSGSRGQVRSWLVLRMSIGTESLRLASLDYLVNMRFVSSIVKALLKPEIVLVGELSDMASCSRFTVH